MEILFPLYQFEFIMPYLYEFLNQAEKKASKYVSYKTSLTTELFHWKQPLWLKYKDTPWVITGSVLFHP